MLFKDIIGQEETKERLINSVKQNRISHAQLFTGATGIGKLALALAYAQYISCTNKKEKDACGECPSCIKYNKLTHPDLFFVFPVIEAGGKGTKTISDDLLPLWREVVIKSPYFTLNDWLALNKSENKQGTIYVEECNNIIKKLSLKPLEAAYKIMLVWHPEKMNVTAANKLLKLIEEPPLRTLFLFITEFEEQLLQTIRSRLQVIRVPKIEIKSLKRTLIDRNGISEEEAEYISKISRGSFTEAKNTLEESEEEKKCFDLFVNFMRLCYSKKVVEIIALADKFHSIGKEAQKRFLSFSLRLLRENFVLNFNNSNLNYLKRKENEFSSKFAKFINENNIVKLLNDFSQAEGDIIRNGYAKLIFLDLSIQVMRVLKK